MAKVYSVYDKVAQEFGPPYVAKNDGVAMRQFMDFRREKLPPHIIDDFSLYCLAEWDDPIGLVKVHPAPVEVFLLDSALPTKVSLEEVK